MRSKKHFRFVNTLTISTKLSISYLLIGVVTLLTVSSILYLIFKNTIIEKTTNQLVAVNVIKKKSIEDFLSGIVRDVRDDEFQLNALHSMHDLHILDNTYKINSNDSLFNPSIRSSYKDIVFMDSLGKIIQHEAFNNILPDSTLHILHKELRSTHTSHNNEIFFVDITYLFAEAHAQLLCVFKLKNASVWGLYFIDHTYLEDILEIRSGMGSTGESYLVGTDYYMRSKSRFLQNTRPNSILVKTDATLNPNKGDIYSESKLIKDYRGVDVISVQSEIGYAGIQWLLISEIDLEEAMATVNTIRNYMIGIALLISVALMIVTLILVKRIINPIENLTRLIDTISIGKFNQPFRKQNFSKDEIGKIEDAIINLQQRISATASFANAIGQGDYTSEYKTLSPEDTLGSALLKMRADIVTGKQKEKVLTKQKTSALIEGQEKERERLARELHDGLGQMLTAIRLRIGLLKEDTQSKKDIQKIIDDTISELRRISNNVMPAVLIDFGLEAGLKSLVDYSGKLYQLPIQLSYISYPYKSIAKNKFDITISLYRIAQEAINNAVKYSNMTRIDIYVEETEDELIMSIEDDGVGFDINKKNTGKGLGNMSERAKLIDGKFQIESNSDGTSITICVPLTF
ncbi:sensor histidine kinase [uncultured Cytophaga sp.]|uniref:sensor histidine kinase n=1 Tax=uncultured Cytophaga sp. TaxID=160238 RepID=UPI002629F223|nr:sensor histidine kinase [uncultured Cytophaga sp.]